MILTVEKNTEQQQLQHLISLLEKRGLEINFSEGQNFIVLGLVGDTTALDVEWLKSFDFVREVTRVQQPYKKANRMFHPQDSVIDVSGVKVGGNEKIAVIAGPCSVEGQDSVCEIARAVKEAGASMLRGGAYKPRTSPYAFQGMGSAGIDAMVQARKQTGLPIVSELMSTDKLDEFVQKVDLIQVGARNMQNFDLLKALGKTDKPVLLKRGMANTIEEWIMAAEYILAGGNQQVILCERGIRTFEKYTRNTLDLSVVPIIKERTHLPIIIDPSHATGDWRLVESMSLAAIAAGADGLIIEVHPCPECAWSDGAQSLKPQKFRKLMDKARQIAQVLGREIA